MKLPAHLWDIVTVGISTLVSVFGPDIRFALSAALKKGGNKFRQRSLVLAENRLRLINLVNGNAYNLLIWIIAELRPPVFFSFSLPASLLAWSRFPVTASLFIYVVYGTWLGTLIRIYNVVEMLRHYPKAKAELEQEIAELKAI
jgi:hypothetical protein